MNIAELFIKRPVMTTLVMMAILLFGWIGYVLSVIFVEPRELTEVIESTPAIVENSRSSGMATAVDIVFGLAPDSPALTTMVGKSTLGRSLTGSYSSA